MEVEWGSEFERVLRRVEKGAKSGDPVARIKYDHLRALLDELAQLSGRPEAESRTFKRVRQARRYELWRIARAFRFRQSQIGRHLVRPCYPRERSKR
jgi:hypothetical protein